MPRSATPWLLGTVTLVLTVALTACNADGGTGDDARRLDALAEKVDALADEAVPAAQEALDSRVHSWRGEFQVCTEEPTGESKDQATDEVSYVVTAQLNGRDEPAGAIADLVDALDDLGWDSRAPDGRGFDAEQDGVTAEVLVGPAASELMLTSACVAVADEVGSEYGGRAPVDFLAD